MQKWTDEIIHMLLLFGCQIHRWERSTMRIILGDDKVMKIIEKVMNNHRYSTLAITVRFVNKVHLICWKIKRNENIEKDIRWIVNNDFPLSFNLRLMEMINKYGNKRVNLYLNNKFLHLYLDQNYQRRTTSEKIKILEQHISWLMMTLNC